MTAITRIHARGRLIAPRQGFSLVENMTVLAILGILLGLGFFGFGSARQSADRITGDAEAVIAKLERKTPQPPRGAKPTAIPDQHLYVFHVDIVDVQAELQRLAKVASFRVLHVYAQAFKGFSAHVTPENHALLRQDAAIQGVEQDFKICMQTQQVPRGVQRSNANLNYPGMSAAAARANTNRRTLQQSRQKIWSNVVVAVMDSGIDASHPELNVVFSRGFVGGRAEDVADLHGHGTHVAGTIGAINNTLGVVGIAPGVRLYNLKIVDADGSGTISDLIAGLNYVHAHAKEIHVLNLSLGGPFSALVNRAVDNCVQAGVVVVVAAGNESKPVANSSPASAAGAITVGALADSDGKSGRLGLNTGAGQDDTFATFSNYGPAVKVLAPGVKIASTYPIYKGAYAVMSGTSMAAPHVAGLAARIQNASMTPGAPGASRYFPGRPVGTRATPAEVLSVLQQNAAEKVTGRFDAGPYSVLNAQGF